MTTGIYKISFNNTDKVYIGQSLNIESRWISHVSELKKGTASRKLQEAYDTYGLKNLEIILECTASELNDAEKNAIEIYNSFINGFNSVPDYRTPILIGENNANASHGKNDYIKVLQLLVQKNPSYSKKEISKITGVSTNIIRHIAALESHTWLKEFMPIEYKQLEDLKINNKYYRGTQYPKLMSPSGDIYEVVHLSNFAKKHGLLQPRITEVMKGTRNHHKGWTRAKV